MALPRPRSGRGSEEGEGSLRAGGLVFIQGYLTCARSWLAPPAEQRTQLLDRIVQVAQSIGVAESNVSVSRFPQLAQGVSRVEQEEAEVGSRAASLREPWVLPYLLGQVIIETAHGFSPSFLMSVDQKYEK